MGRFRRIPSTRIERALEGTTRQYFLGRLQRPQALEHIGDDNLEIGISAYPEDASEAPHAHRQAYEYHYLLSGYTEYRDLDTGEVHGFRAGDFYVIEPGTRYAQRVRAGTRLIFIKYPPGNDKLPESADADMARWLAEPVTVSRRDHERGGDGPPANSLKPAVTVGISRDDGCILLLRRRDSDRWTLPGGVLELGEDVRGCAIREIREETGLTVAGLRVVGVYSDPAHRIEYSDGEVRQQFAILLHGHADAGDVRIDPESTAAHWCPPGEALRMLDMPSGQRRRIRDLMTHLTRGDTFIR